MSLEGVQKTHQHSLRELSIVNTPVYQVKCSLTFWDIFVHVIGWSLLSIVTLGIGFFLAPYSLIRLIANNTILIDKDGNTLYPHSDASIGNDFTIPGMLGWILVCYLTLGGLLPFFYIAVYRRGVNSIQIHASIETTIINTSDICATSGIYQNNCRCRSQIAINKGDVFPLCPKCQNPNTTWLLVQPVVNEEFIGTDSH